MSMNMFLFVIDIQECHANDDIILRSLEWNSVFQKYSLSVALNMHFKNPFRQTVDCTCKFLLLRGISFNRYFFRELYAKFVGKNHSFRTMLLTRIYHLSRLSLEELWSWKLVTVLHELRDFLGTVLILYGFDFDWMHL